MKGIIGSMNVNFSERYDEEDDIYYVSFETGEPSYAEEVDDILIIERGIYTNMPTGFRILNFHKHKVGGVRILVKRAKTAIDKMEAEAENCLEKRTAQAEKTIEQFLTDKIPA